MTISEAFESGLRTGRGRGWKLPSYIFFGVRVPFEKLVKFGRLYLAGYGMCGACKASGLNYRTARKFLLETQLYLSSPLPPRTSNLKRATSRKNAAVARAAYERQTKVEKVRVSVEKVGAARAVLESGGTMAQAAWQSGISYPTMFRLRRLGLFGPRLL